MYLLPKLQRVHNNAARLVPQTARPAYVTLLFHSLHWFPVEQRIEYKLSLLCFEIISAQAPVYLSDLLRLLRSFSAAPLFCRHVNVQNTSLSHQLQWSAVFLVLNPNTIWNKLPASIRHASCVSSFKTFSLKIFLFSKTFSSVPLT